MIRNFPTIIEVLKANLNLKRDIKVSKSSLVTGRNTLFPFWSCNQPFHFVEFPRFLLIHHYFLLIIKG